MIGPEDLDMAVYAASVAPAASQADNSGLEARRWYDLGVMTLGRILIDQLGET
jgi:hypothetical protein